MSGGFVMGAAEVVDGALKVHDLSEEQVEARIVASGAEAPRLRPADVDAVIVAEQYHVFPGTTVTICLLQLRNGFSVTGHSAAASVENFNEEIGRGIARKNAREKIWALEGYLLKERLHSAR